MYYRRKILLQLLHTFGGALPAPRLQALMLLLARRQEAPAYHFAPTPSGAWSFQLEHDLERLAQKDYLIQTREDGYTHWKLAIDPYALPPLDAADERKMEPIYHQYHACSLEDLQRHIFSEHPYYAIRFPLIERLLKGDALKAVEQQKERPTEQALLTTGYEGKSLEKYLNQLLGEGVQLLCDVRHNPNSRKYGFSKNQLSDACLRVGIAYEHIPELGIEKEKRQDIDTPGRRAELFDEYERVTLLENRTFLHELTGFFQQYDRIAITCYEADPEQCHRSRIVKVLKALPMWGIPVKNL